jgi:hypothetical protein
MAVPAGEKKVVHLHADCFIFWNEERRPPVVASTV